MTESPAKSLHNLLEIMSSIYPDALDFQQIIGADKIDADITGGTLAFLLREELVEESGFQYKYRISEKGKKLLAEKNSGPAELDEEVAEKLMPALQPHDWKEKDKCIWKNILDQGEDLPLLSVGQDLPETFEPLPQTANNSEHAELFFKAALKNIQKVEVPVNEVDLKEFKLVVVTGNYYAAEKIFDKIFMHAIQKQQNWPMLAVAVPRKGTLYAIDGVSPPEIMRKFLLIAAMKFNEQEASKPLASTVFIVQDGEIRGVIQPVDPA
jgi:hypothetical protein